MKSIKRSHHLTCRESYAGHNHPTHGRTNANQSNIAALLSRMALSDAFTLNDDIQTVITRFCTVIDQSWKSDRFPPGMTSLSLFTHRIVCPFEPYYLSMHLVVSQRSANQSGPCKRIADRLQRAWEYSPSVVENSQTGFAYDTGEILQAIKPQIWICQNPS